MPDARRISLGSRSPDQFRLLEQLSSAAPPFDPALMLTGALSVLESLARPNGPE
jgi:hypothetical protein